MEKVQLELWAVEVSRESEGFRLHLLTLGELYPFSGESKLPLLCEVKGLAVHHGLRWSLSQTEPCTNKVQAVRVTIEPRPEESL